MIDPGDAGPPAVPRRGVVAHLLAAASVAGACLACGSTSPTAEARPDPCPAGGSPYAVRVLSLSMPDCSLEQNYPYVDERAVLGPPDAQRLPSGPFAGFLSLGRGGSVIVETGACVADEPGPDVRVYQAVTSEPVTLYAAAQREGPYRLLEARKRCGVRSPGLFSNHCDFDLEAGGLAVARYFRIRDGESTPCWKATTDTEGADIDAIEVLHPAPR